MRVYPLSGKETIFPEEVSTELCIGFPPHIECFLDVAACYRRTGNIVYGRELMKDILDIEVVILSCSLTKSTH